MSNRPGLFLFSERWQYRLIRHLGMFISMNCLFIVVALSRSSSADTVEIVWSVFENSLFFFAYAYLTAFVLVPFFLLKFRYLFFFTLFIIFGLIISYIKFIFSDMFFHEIVSEGIALKMKAVKLSDLILNTKDMSFIVAIFIIAKFSKDNYYIKSRVRDLKDSQLEAEISLIENQLDPHVIFNNLNNLYSIALNTPREAPYYIGKLKDLLSYYFIDANTEMVTVSSEVRAISDYLELEQLRYGDRLELDLQCDNPASEYVIIPFLLFPLVENAIEHGCSAESGSSWMKVRLRLDDDNLYFHISNSKPEGVLADASGIDGSLMNVRRKLELFYKGQNEFIVRDFADRFHVDLIIRRLCWKK